MLATAVTRALADLLSPPFRAALWKVLGLTALFLVALWFAVEALFGAFVLPLAGDHLPQLPDWATGAGTLAGWAAGLVLAVALFFLIGPVSAITAGFFLDDVAAVVERTRYPEAPQGREMPLLPALWLSLKFFGIVILGNLLAFALLLVPGLHFVAFFLVNGYLLGREYFEFAALRYRPEEEAKALRRRHAGLVFLGGAAIAAFLAVPLLNLLTPLFAAALMVNLHRLVTARSEADAKVPRHRSPSTSRT
ncbi:cysteine biosynthesis protein [Aureimonas endophytica]|uniref:Cysteine biosynthesis protein n=1 Tax=Aureimonas endophytica TaxID=2027858 RepID=A0A917E878_9HYPH|nr:sulfate transporter family protein [Aureimonas endophytica]GGE08840.1 cysteine biosynthesis protein [Aureimonas endophytica]